MENKKNKNIITSIKKGSIAEQLELEEGDELLGINNEKINDYIDYKYYISDEKIILNIKKSIGEIWDCEIEKEYDEDIGIVFENPLMDNVKTCRNKCIFCFIDQLPKGMRKTLYIKDDDSRLSLLYGNFITLTNLSEEELKRIIKYHISPIKVSVHTTNPELRINMLRNPKAGRIMEVLKKLKDANIVVDCQIVLCKGINDNEELDRTIYDLGKLYPSVRSIAVVPVGLTKYRKKLSELERYDKESALSVIEQISKLQKKYLNKINTRFVFLSDEFYVLSDKELPSAKSYEGFFQIENGIGMFKLFEKEVYETLEKYKSIKENTCSEFNVITGTAAYNFMKKITKKISNKVGVKINVIPIINNFFGNSITVAGLITGRDIIDQLKEKQIDNIIIPKCMLKYEENMFLDNITTNEIEKSLKAKVYTCDVNGEKFVNFFKKQKRCNYE